MSTRKITQKELEEMVREMVTKMVNEVPGEAPIMEKKSIDDVHHMTAAQKKKREDIALAIKQRIGKKEFEKRSKEKWNNPYAIATAAAMKSDDESVNEEKAEFTKKYDDNPKLKGGQDKLPDHLQKAIIKKKGGKTDEDLEERNMAFSWQRSAANPKKKRTHYLDEDKLKELEERKRAIIKQLEELDFGGPAVAEPETETEEDIEITTPPGRPNPFRREEHDTEIIPDLEPQGSLRDVVKRYIQMKK